MAECSRKCRMKAAFIIIMIYASGIFILSIAQLFNKGDYGYKKILSYVENFMDELEEENVYCEEYFSDIKFKKNFAKVKTIINVLYNFYLFIYGLSRLEELGGKCRLGMLFSFILLLGNFTELILTTLAYDYFDKLWGESSCYKTKKRQVYNPNEKKYDYYDYSYEYLFENNSIRRLKDVSAWVIELDKGIIVLCAASTIPIIYLFCKLLSQDCETSKCIEKDFYWICSSIYKCMEGCCGLCVSCCESFGGCCRKCKGNDSSSLTQKKQLLTEENNNLRNDINKLRNEIKDLEREKNLGENNFNSERIQFQDEILILNQRTDQNLMREKNLKEEFNALKQKNIELFKEKEELKNINQKMNKDLENMENKIILENKELKQLKIFQFYTNQLTPENQDKNNDPKVIAKKELLHELEDNYALIVDSNKFKEIALFYIKSKLIENLTDSKTNDIFSKPVITQDGKTVEGKNLSKSKNYIENKLVSELCKILKENEGDLTFDNFQKIKKLLISKETGKYYRNPIIIISGKDMGETIEDIDNENNGIKNIIIKNIIGDIRELLDDDFFIFEKIDTNTNEITANDNNINNIDNFNGFTITGFGDV